MSRQLINWVFHSVFIIGTLFDANRSTPGSVLILQEGNIAVEVMMIMIMKMTATIMMNRLFT